MAVKVALTALADWTHCLRASLGNPEIDFVAVNDSPVRDVGSSFEVRLNSGHLPNEISVTATTSSSTAKRSGHL